MSVSSLTDQSDPKLGNEIAAVPFSNIIGGAFKAVVDAQAQASMTTINFIQSCGFKKGSGGSSSFGEPIMVEFKYSKPAGAFGQGALAKPHRVRVPFLALIPIPHLRIDSLDIVFAVKLTATRQADINNQYTTTSINTTSSENSFNSTEDVTYDKWKTGKTSQASSGDENSRTSSKTRYGFRDGYKKNTNWSSSSSMVGIITTQSYNQQGMQVSREYSLKVEVQAVQDKIPAGMERILDILVNSVGTNTGGPDLATAAVTGAMGGAPGMGAAPGGGMQ